VNVERIIGKPSTNQKYFGRRRATQLESQRAAQKLLRIVGEIKAKYQDEGRQNPEMASFSKQFCIRARLQACRYQRRSTRLQALPPPAAAKAVSGRNGCDGTPEGVP
jgi:hypothetical protein